MMKFFFAFLISGSVFAGTNFNKVLIVVFENTDYSQAVKQPYFSSLMKEGSLATNYFALMHPSQPNYVALIGGSTFGVRDDRNVTLDQRHLGNLLEDAKKSWKVYAEDYPGNCFLGSQQGNYVRKHVPFLSFLNVQNDPARCARVQNASNFKTDFDAGKLPEFSFYIPDLQNDGHDTGVAFGDKWLKANFDPIFKSTKMPKDLLVIITFDEGSHSASNQIYTLFWGANSKKNFSTNKKYDHYSLLRTIEEEFSLGSLGQNDKSANTISDIWMN